MEVKILHLYHDIMNLYGEYGNIKILEKHLQDQGIDVTIDKKSIGEEKNLKEYDFIYMGCGTEKNQEVILQDITKEKEDLKSIIEEGKVILFTGNSYEILGKRIDEKEGLEILDLKTTHNQNRVTADIICTSKLLKNKAVGFINTMSQIENNEDFLFEVEWKSDNNEENKNEGIVYKNLFGTQLIGPLLIRNPEFLKMIIEKICKQKDENFKYKEIQYEDEQKGYELVLKELENRKQSK